MLLSLIGIVLVAPFFVVALTVGARAVSLSQSAWDDLLMIALAFCGAIASIVNGLGRGQTDAARDRQTVAETKRTAKTASSSAIGLGY